MTWTTRPRSEYARGIAGICSGDGAPLVLIHGIGLTADSWGAQIAPLAERYRVHALDLPGHGVSTALNGTVTLADLTDAIADVIRDIGAPVRVAGHSLGALITMDLATRHPELCSAIVALNAVHRRGPEAQDAVAARARSLSPVSLNDPSATLTRWFGNDLARDEAKACKAWLTHIDPAIYKITYGVFAMSDSPSDTALHDLNCPALFLTGADEPNSTPVMSEALAALTPHGRSVIVEGAAHMVMMTHPLVVNEELLAFFSETEALGG